VGWVTIHDTYACPPSVLDSMAITPSTTTSTSTARMNVQSTEYSAINSGNVSSKNSFFNDNSSHSSYKDGENNESTSTEKKDEKVELNGKICKLNYIGNKSEHANCNIMNGKNAYYDYRNTDIKVVNEKIHRALVEKRIQNEISNLSDDKNVENGNEVLCKIKKDRAEDTSDRNKINLRGYHMNGTVDIDELLISFINQTSQNGATTNILLNQNVNNDEYNSLIYCYNPNNYNNNINNSIDMSNNVSNNGNSNNNKNKNKNEIKHNNNPNNLQQQQQHNKNKNKNAQSKLLTASRLSDVRKGLKNLTQLTLGMLLLVCTCVFTYFNSICHAYVFVKT
jgi:hypothetical protein